MAIQEKVFNRSMNKFGIYTMSAKVIIRGDRVDNSIIRYDDNMDVSTDNGIIFIQQLQENQPRYVNENVRVGNTNISISGCNFSGNSSVIGNYSNSQGGNPRTPDLELILPKESFFPEIEMESESGEISIRDLFLMRLIITAKSGNINLRGFDSYLTMLSTTCGNVSAEIIESILNYNTTIKSSCGRAIKDSTETQSPEILQIKRIFSALSDCGDINLTFKGKSR